MIGVRTKVLLVVAQFHVDPKAWQLAQEWGPALEWESAQEWELVLEWEWVLCKLENNRFQKKAPSKIDLIHIHRYVL